jgi:thiol-disulfide isomerase/thioredoxin
MMIGYFDYLPNVAAAAGAAPPAAPPAAPATTSPASVKAGSGRKASGAPDTVAPGARESVTYSVRTLDGAPFRIGPGEQTTLVAVCATWSASCRTEFASLDSLRRALASRGVRVLARSVDEGDDARVRRYAAARRTQVQVAHDGTGVVGRMFGLVGVPESYLVDRAGVVRSHRQGDLRTGLAGLTSAVQSLSTGVR